MAIRFQCSACAQPIEVDDEWASKAVACPYCHKAVTAPCESTLGNLSRIPTATPLTRQAGDPASPWPHPYPHAVETASTNRIAVVALVLALVVVGLTGVYLNVLRAHRLELETWYRPGITLGEQVRAFSEYVESQQGRVPAWLMAASLLPLTAGSAWIAALVCGVVGVRRPQRRGLAVAALLVAGFVPLLLCCGGGFILGSQV